MKTQQERARLYARTTIETLKKIELKCLQREASLMSTKWPAYLFMSPHYATLQFKEIYKECTKEHLRQHVDMEWQHTHIN